MFLFFPVLRRGSIYPDHGGGLTCFYSSPSCDGDLTIAVEFCENSGFYSSPSCDGDHDTYQHGRFSNVSILPRLATGIFP